MDLMDVTTLSDTQSPEAAALANIYANQHERLDNFIFIYAAPSRLFRKTGVEIYSRRGYLLLVTIYFFTIFIPGFILTALTSQWAEMPFLRLVAAAAALSVLNVIALIIAQAAAFKISALHRTLQDVEQIRALIQWDRRWFGPGISALMGSIISVALLVILYLLSYSVNGIRLPATTLWICAVITVFLGQFSFSTTMVFFEFRKLSTCRFGLYKLNPYDTFQLQRTGSGLKQLGMVSTFSTPLFLLVLLLILPEGSSLNVPISAGFLFMYYLAAAVGILFPLGFLGAIVKAEKWRLLGPIQAELNQLTARLRSLSKDEYEYFIHLQTLYQTINTTKDSFLSFSSIARIGGTLVLATISVIIPAIIEKFL